MNYADEHLDLPIFFICIFMQHLSEDSMSQLLSLYPFAISFDMSFSLLKSYNLKKFIYGWL